MGKQVLIDRSGLQKALGLSGLPGKIISGFLYWTLGVEKLNRKYPAVADLTGPEFSYATLRELGISFEIPDGQVENIPLKGGFLTVSNHHFGGADGLILNAVVGSRRKDFKILTTFLLASIPNLTDCFIPVNNFSSGGAKSVRGIRKALGHIAEGGPLGLFPAGEVATWQKKGRRTATGGERVIEDKPWSENIIKLIAKSGLPVVPIYFDGTNSRTFHVLGRLHPMLRTVRLVRELVAKGGSTIKVRIGKPIPAGEFTGMDTESLGKYLRSRCYALEAQCISCEKKMTEESPAGLAPKEDPDLVRAQMELLEDKVVFQTGDYRAYLIEAQDAPAAMRELYRLREETFRAIGEGTGNPSDTDLYDGYYKHLILWNVPDSEIAGAYRVGYGSEIIPSHGPEGLYTASLVKYLPDAVPVLSTGMELGRSFIAEKYQREVLPLKLMLSGLTVAAAQDPSDTSSFGTVSISDSLPDFYKSLAVYFLERDFKLPGAELFALAPNPFKPSYLRINPEDLLKAVPRGDIDAFDRFLSTLSDGRYRLPVLFRKYFSCGARVACFNVDPLFHNCLDALIVLRNEDFPPKMLRSIIRPLSEEDQETVYSHFYGTSMESLGDSYLMIRPVRFGFNPQTAGNNKFQHESKELDSQQRALEEFDGMAGLLKKHGIRLLVLEDSMEQATPDSIFPNNWITTHSDGSLVLYPMFAPNRRDERRQEVIDAVRGEAGTRKIVDLTGWEAEGKFLEGTGSMVLDRKTKTAYSCRSPRTSEGVLKDFCDRMGYQAVLFDAADRNGDPIYHTNVMMSLGDDFAAICKDAFTSATEYLDIERRLKSTGRRIVEISFDQMLHYACNLLEVKNVKDERFIVLSDTALSCLDEGQVKAIKGNGTLIPVHIPFIEKTGGGSARCMLAELFHVQ